MTIIFSIIAIVIAFLSFFYTIIKDFKDKNKIKRFQGTIGIDEKDGKDTENFIEFIIYNEGKIIYLDINFKSNDIYELDETGYLNVSIFYDIDNKLLGGYSFRIKFNNSDDFFLDSRPSSNRLSGNFKIIGIIGPQQGWFTALMKPVKLELLQ